MRHLRWGALVLLVVAGSAAAQSNLASALDGAGVEKASSALDKSFRAENLLDGDAGTTWATGRGKLEDQYVVIKLAVRRPVEIGAIAIDNTVAAGHPAEAALRQFKLAVSVGGTAATDFTQIKLGSCELGGARQVFTFRPARAEYVKLTLGGNFGHSEWIELAEVEVFAAGAPPVGAAGTPSILLITAAPDAAATPFAAVAASLVELGATVGAAPGPEASGSLGAGALRGYRVAVVSGDRAPDRAESRVLSRHVERGGGLVCAVPADPGPLGPLLEGFEVAATGSPGPAQAVEFASHWITDDLAPPQLPDPSPALAAEGSAPLARFADGPVIALAKEAGAGRLVVLPEGFLRGEHGEDAVELSRRAILWAAAMEDTPPPRPPEPVRLAGTGVFLPAPSSGSGLTFAELHRAVAEHGMALEDFAGDPTQFDRSALGEGKLLIACMPAIGGVVALDLADWVRSGGSLLVLGDAAAQTPDLVAVNGFLREFGAAMTLSPSRNLSVAVRSHPATAGVEALSRPGEPLGVWCLQATPLASMAGTPVALARSFGRGRLILMDAGFAADLIEPPSDRKKAPPAFGIQLGQNREFMLRCVAWLLAGD